MNENAALSSHQHHHEHCTCGCTHYNIGAAEISVQMHDLSTVGTVRCKLDTEYFATLDLLKTCMREAAGEIELLGGVIGHIKASLSESPRTTILSMTDSSMVRENATAQQLLMIETANIVFGISATQLERILQQSYAALSQLYAKSL